MKLTFEQLDKLSNNLGIARGAVLMGVGLAAAYGGIRLVDYLNPRVTRLIQNRVPVERVWRSRRIETFMGTTASIAKVVVFVTCVAVAWQLMAPTSKSVTIVGASAVVAIVLGSVIGPLFRDITLGSMMIAEDWYNVGDHIIVVPFNDVRGVVEQLTPRSTKIRSLTGEVIWMHNQNIMGARVTSRGVRTIALDVFVRDQEAGEKVMRQAIRTVPTGPTMLAGPLKLGEVEKLSDELYRISAVGQTMPGREWLIEDFAVNAIKKYDALNNEVPVIVHGPIAHHADATAERKFKRTIRAQNETAGT